MKSVTCKEKINPNPVLNNPCGIHTASKLRTNRSYTLTEQKVSKVDSIKIPPLIKQNCS